jgi:transcriptional regulator with XRE-family HTH domain
MLGITQQQLADKVGIKFQQIQKYETGMNRISASRLWDIANAMNVSIAFFFEGLGSETAAPADKAPVAFADPVAEREAMELVRSYTAIPAKQRRRLFDLARALSEVA